MALQLGDQRDAMVRKVEEIEGIEGKIHFPSKVWIYRTRPRLDILTALCRKLVGTKWSDTKSCKDFMAVVLKALEEMESHIDTLQVFEQLEEETMRLVQRQAEEASLFIGKCSAREVRNELMERLSLPRVLGVRVVSCSGLPAGNDPYVRLRVKQEGRWLKTDSRQNARDPTWHTDTHLCEFRFLLNGKETELEAEVMHEVSGMSDTYIGAAAFSMSDMEKSGKGAFITMSKMLKDCPQAKVTLQVLLASEVSHLIPLNYAKPTVEPKDELAMDEETIVTDPPRGLGLSKP
jgi:hypothetical protein